MGQGDRREKGEDIPSSQLGCSRRLTEWSRTNLEGRLEGAGKMVRRGSLQTETVSSIKTWKPGRRCEFGILVHVTLTSGTYGGVVEIEIVWVQAKLLSQRDPKMQWLKHNQSLFLSGSSLEVCG